VNIPAGIAGEAIPPASSTTPPGTSSFQRQWRPWSRGLHLRGEHGTISGWSPLVDSNNAILVHDDGDEGAIYKGIALAGNGTENRIYVTISTTARSTSTTVTSTRWK
jgi:hypothetical protein